MALIYQTKQKPNDYGDASIQVGEVIVEDPPTAPPLHKYSLNESYKTKLYPSMINNVHFTLPGLDMIHSIPLSPSLVCQFKVIIEYWTSNQKFSP